MARESARHAGISATEPPVPAEDDPLPPAMLQGGGPWLFLISSTWHEVTAISPVASFRLLDFMSDSEAGWAKNSCVFQLEDPNMLDLPQCWFFVDLTSYFSWEIWSIWFHFDAHSRSNFKAWFQRRRRREYGTGRAIRCCLAASKFVVSLKYSSMATRRDYELDNISQYLEIDWAFKHI